MQTGTLGVIVVTFNSAAVIAECLRTLPAGLVGIDSCRVLVVDNASVDGTPELAASVLAELAPLPGGVAGSVLESGRNGGYAAAINAGLAALEDADEVLILNPDTRLRPGSIAVLAKALRRSHAGIAAPRLVDVTGRTSYSLRRDPGTLRQLGEIVLGGNRAGRYHRLGEMVTDPARYDQAGWADWATGAVLLVSRACREAVGDWDESFFLYSEETDFCQRARRAGFGVRYVPESVVEHIGGELETSPELRRHLVRNTLTLHRRQHSAMSGLAYRTAVAANETSRALSGRRTHRAGLASALGFGATAAVAPMVIFSAQDSWYHNRAHSDVQLARGISGDRPVLLVNSIGMRMPTPGNTTRPLRRILRKLRSTMKAVRVPESRHPTMRVTSPLILPFYRNARLRAVNAWLVRAQVRLVCRAIGFRRPHLLVTIPTAWDVVRQMKRRSLIVNRSDRYSAFPESDHQLMREMELNLLREADAAVFVSHALMDAEQAAVGGTAHFLGHGVDFERFAAARADEAPADIAAIGGPRIGFFGGLDDYIVDFGLLGRLADEIPEAQLVLIGDATCSMAELTDRPNVHWLGYRPYDEIPGYGSAFDVAIMPWLRNEWSEHCNPIKAKEYLALGMPVVSTYYPEVESLREVIAVAADQDEFIEQVRAALAGNPVSDTRARRESVRGESWQARAGELLSLADRLGR